MSNAVRSRNTNEKIEIALKNIRNIEKCLEDILKEPDNDASNAKSMSKICQQHNISYIKLRTLINSVNGIYTEGMIDKENLTLPLDPYRNFYTYFFGIKYIKEIEFPPDLEESVELAINCLNERAQDIIRKYFFEFMTLEQIAKSYSISIQRIRQILTKSFRVMRHRYCNEIKYGIKKAELIKNQEEKEKLNTLKEIMDQIKSINESDTDSIIDKLYLVLMETNIDVLGLSQRSYNGLILNGYSNLYSITSMMPYEILQLRSIGHKSLIEIQEKLNQYLKHNFHITWNDVYKLIQLKKSN